MGLGIKKKDRKKKNEGIKVLKKVRKVTACQNQGSKEYNKGDTQRGPDYSVPILTGSGEKVSPTSET